MTIPVYKSELDAGLAEQIQATASVAYSSPILIDQQAGQEVSADDLITYASDLKDGINQWDLYYIKSVLVSIGWNLNDDVFDIKETWAARHTPVHKKFNLEHDETQIIGHMVSSIVVDGDGNIITDEEDIPNKFDIIVGSVIYKSWRDKELKEQIAQLIDEIAEDKWFVSMECTFSDFDYAVVDESGKNYVIARNDATSFLTKHLRIYEGTGYYKNKKIGRLLRNMTFSGKGLVSKPANKKSIIFNTASNIFEPEETQATINKEDYDMAESNATIDTLKEQLATLKAEKDALAAEAKAAAEKAAQAVVEKITGLEGKVTESVAALAKKDEELAAKATEVAEAGKALDAVKAELAEAKATITKVEQEKTQAARITKLVEVGVESAEASKVVTKWASASDEQFDDVVKLHSQVAKTPEVPKTEEITEDSNESTASTEIENAEPTEDDAALAAAGSKKNEEVMTAAASWMRKISKFNQTKNGENK